MKRTVVILGILLGGNMAQAAPAFTGQDYSGVYQCTGMDAHEGSYTGTVTMALNPAQSTGEHGAYNFRLDVPDFGAYHGLAVSQGEHLAVYFALQDQSTRDYGIGIAKLGKDAEGRLQFGKFYYEPEYKGGNTGTEECVMTR